MKHHCLWSLLVLICWYQGYWGVTMLPTAQHSLLGVSVPLLLSTDSDTQEGGSNRATEAPTAEHGDDNSPGYTVEIEFTFQGPWGRSRESPAACVLLFLEKVH
ncbi:hypothetical protein E1301_Tti024287 [Triplophysa tibetana]|uniref:Uncharacterized protein n=1 Tax=Triplophysa tibetana TaxID=1572043 RepID=A0A5A9MY89_9TELE|nr:hypothetical protein E1301_Tti024287 [Triplophysa tibetana]